MSINILSVAVKFIYCFVKHFHPAFHIGTCATIYKGMAAVKYQVAHVYDISMLEMDHGIAISMSGAIIIKTDLFLAEFIAPGIRECLVRIKLFVLVFIFYGHFFLVLQ